MDITPVSMQMIYPSANEATNVQHNLNHATNLQQDFESLRQKQEDELKQKQVQHKDNPEGGNIIVGMRFRKCVDRNVALVEVCDHRVAHRTRKLLPAFQRPFLRDEERHAGGHTCLNGGKELFS